MVPNVPGMADSSLVQPHWFLWDSFQLVKSTEQGAGSEKSSSELRKGQPCLSPTPQTLPVHLLQCISNPRTSVRNSNWVQHCKPNGYNWPVKDLCRKQSRRISIGRLTALPLGYESHSHVQQGAPSKEPSSWKRWALQAAGTVPENRPTVVNVNTTSHCL